MKKNDVGVLFIVSGPSGVGKGTLLARLFEAMPELRLSVSCTTRSPRPGERDGVEYHFIDELQFAEHVSAGDFLEHAGVHGHHYGTLRADVLKVLAEGRDMFLEIDVQGALQVKAKMPEAVTVFIAPPSLEVLEKRLRDRNTESEEDLRLRLHNAAKEMEQAKHYDFAVVNDQLDVAVDELVKFVKSRG